MRTATGSISCTSPDRSSQYLYDFPFVTNPGATYPTAVLVNVGLTRGGASPSTAAGAGNAAAYDRRKMQLVARAAVCWRMMSSKAFRSSAVLSCATTRPGANFWLVYLACACPSCCPAASSEAHSPSAHLCVSSLRQ